MNFCKKIVLSVIDVFQFDEDDMDDGHRGPSYSYTREQVVLTDTHL
jgi:hypothetical protein